MYSCSKHAHFSQFDGDHSTCTQPARVQEALTPQVHCDERPDTYMLRPPYTRQHCCRQQCCLVYDSDFAMLRVASNMLPRLDHCSIPGNMLPATVAGNNVAWCMLALSLQSCASQ